jgi:hypothetical protein
MLKDILVKGLSKLNKTFNNILSIADPHQPQPKFVSRHPPQHLKNEQRFKDGQRGGSTHPEGHRKILTTNKNK